MKVSNNNPAEQKANKQNALTGSRMNRARCSKRETESIPAVDRPTNFWQF